MIKMYKIVSVFFILFLFLLCSCEPKNSNILSDYPNSIWVSDDNFICKVEISINSSSEITSIITYQEQSINFNNYIISEIIYFISLDNSKKFTVKHNYVKQDSILSCSVKKSDILTIFDINNYNENDEISFDLIKCY